jgi:hypothetical protein
MYEDIEKGVKTYEDCQRQSKIRYKEPLHSNMDFKGMGENWSGYCVYAMDGKRRLHSFVRDDLSGWAEGKVIDAAEDVICRHGCPLRIVLDGRRENLDVTKALLEHYKTHNFVISAYHLQTNGLVEWRHMPKFSGEILWWLTSVVASVSFISFMGESDFCASFYWVFSI